MIAIINQFIFLRSILYRYAGGAVTRSLSAARERERGLLLTIEVNVKDLLNIFLLYEVLEFDLVGSDV